MKPDQLTLADKRQRLTKVLRGYRSLVVAFSGGVDSSVLLHAAAAALGDRAAGVIADSPSLPRRDLAEALEFAERLGVQLTVIQTQEGQDENYRANRGDRCYFCKAELFSRMAAWARDTGLERMAFGEITDDAMDHRPGARAAAEFGVVAPLAAAGFGKDDVRAYARAEGLEVWDKPAGACLASRIPVGTEVTRERLATVEAAEELLHLAGYPQVRVRHLGRRARVEVDPEHLDRARSELERLSALLLTAGFESIELAPYLSPAARASQ